MKLDEQIIKYKKLNHQDIVVDKTKIEATIEACKERFLLEEANHILSYRSFLELQFKLIQKRWWLLQFLILMLLWVSLPYYDDILYSYRSMGVGAVLFIILIIPELWKNRINNCLEIESVTYYSLRQVYAARILLFGIVDMILVTLFCLMTTISLKFSISELLIQFLLPMIITACICFGVLCNKHILNETIAIALCIFWSIVWWLILINDGLYSIMIIPIWIIIFILAIVMLLFFIYRTIYQCNKIWEVSFDGNKDN